MLKYIVTESYFYEVEADSQEQALAIYEEWAEQGMEEDETFVKLVDNQLDATEF